MNYEKKKNVSGIDITVVYTCLPNALQFDSKLKIDSIYYKLNSNSNLLFILLHFKLFSNRGNVIFFFFYLIEIK